MAHAPRRFPPPRIRNWKTAINRQPLSRPSSTDKLQVLFEDKPFPGSFKEDMESFPELEDEKPMDLISDLCDPDLELLPPVISQSPFPKRTTIMQNVKLFEESVSPEVLEGGGRNSLQKKIQRERENKSLDLNVLPQLSSVKKALWSSSSAIPGRSSCDSPPLIPEPHRRSLLIQSDSDHDKRPPTTLFMPDSATLTVDHRLPDSSSEHYHMIQSVTDSAFIEAVEDPSLANVSIQIFPHGFSQAAIQFQEQTPAIDRFLLAHQIRRISTHRSKVQSNCDADRRLSADHILRAFKESKITSGSESRPESHSEKSDDNGFDFSDEAIAGSESREDSLQLHEDYNDEGQQKETEDFKPIVHGEPESEIIYKTTSKGIFMDISSNREGNPCSKRTAPVFSRRKSRVSRQTFRPSPSPRPDSRLLPRSNRTLIRNAIARVCLAGGATESERTRALEALDSCISEWFIILLREQRHKFRGLYRVESEGDSQVLIRIFGDGPLQIPIDSVDVFMKYDSANKCFDSLPSRHLTATTDAVSIISKRFGNKPNRTM